MGHNGNSNCTSTLMIDPVAKIGIAIMTNKAGETAYNFGLLSLIFGEYKTNSQITTKSENEDLSGIYTSVRANFKHGFAKIAKYKELLFPLADSLFEPFVLGDASRNMRSGTGLGLAIAKKILEKHNGLLYYDSNLMWCTKAFIIELNVLKNKRGVL